MSTRLGMVTQSVYFDPFFPQTFIRFRYNEWRCLCVGLFGPTGVRVYAP